MVYRCNLAKCRTIQKITSIKNIVKKSIFNNMREIIVEIPKNKNIDEFLLFILDLMDKDLSEEAKKKIFTNMKHQDLFYIDDYVIIFGYPYKCMLCKLLTYYFQKLFLKQYITYCLEISKDEVSIVIKKIQTFGLNAKESDYSQYEKRYRKMWTTDKKNYILQRTHHVNDYTIINKLYPQKLYIFPEFSAAKEYVLEKMISAGIEII
jgi:hypothetical protein